MNEFRWKTVRVFISSTFRDFHAERDHLVKYVFPALREWCQKWKLHLVDIDLRWGVTEEQARNGKVIDICLEQVDGCRPFFLCMLGNRYGWIPQKTEIEEKTLNNYVNLSDSMGRSVTHLEVQHAVLDPLNPLDKDAASYSFFYFRDPVSVPLPDLKGQCSQEEVVKIIEAEISLRVEKTKASISNLSSEEREYRISELLHLQDKIISFLDRIYNDDSLPGANSIVSPVLERLKGLKASKPVMDYAMQLLHQACGHFTAQLSSKSNVDFKLPENAGQMIEHISAFCETAENIDRKLFQLKADIIEYVVKHGVKDGPDLEIKERIFDYCPTFEADTKNPEDDGLIGRFTQESLEEFGARVKSDLTKAISDQFAKRIKTLSGGKKEGKKQREFDLQENFIETMTRLFIGRDKILSRLHTYVLGREDIILALHGPPGCGKSAILAQYYRFITRALQRNMEDQRDKEFHAIKKYPTLVIPHFVGATPGSSSLNYTLRKICQAINEKFGLDEEIPSETIKLVEVLPEFLNNCTEPILIILDALNQMERRDNAHELSWLPAQLPDNVKIIVSTLDGDAWKALGRKPDKLIFIQALSDLEKRKIVAGMPSIFAKTMDKKNQTKLLSKPETDNPLYLKVAVDELRVFGSHDKLSDKIELLPGNVIDLYISVLDRIESEMADYRGKEKGKELVERLFCLLECSRYGLLDKELRALMSDYDLHQDYLAVIRQMREHFQYRDGLLYYYHPTLSKAVQKKFFGKDNKNKRIKYHRELADFFSLHPYWVLHDGKLNEDSINIINDIPNHRVSDELVFQLNNAGLTKESQRVLSDINYLQMKVSLGLINELLFEVGTYSMVAKFQQLYNILQVSSTYLKKDPLQLRSQLWIRNNPYLKVPCEFIIKLIMESKKWKPHPWFKSLNPNRQIHPALIRQTHLHNGPLTQLVLLNNAKFIATGSFDGKIYLLNKNTFDIQATKLALGSAIMSMATDDLGEKLIAGNESGDIFFWNHYQSVAFKTINLQGSAVHACLVFKKGAFAAFGDKKGDITVVSLPELDVIISVQVHSGPITGLLYVEKENRILSTGHDGRLISTCLESYKSSMKADLHEAIRYMCRWENSILLSSDNEPIIYCVDQSTGDHRRTLHLRGQPCRGIEIFDSNVIVLDRLGKAYSFSPDIAETIHDIGYCGQPCYALSISQNKKKIYVGTMDGDLLSYNIGDHELLPFGSVIKEHESKVYSVCWGRRSNTIATGTWNGEVSLWNLTDGKLRLRGRHNLHERGVIAADISSEQNLLTASSDGTVKLTFLSDMIYSRSFRHHMHPCIKVKQSNDGKFAVTLDESCRLRVLDILNGSTIELLEPLLRGEIESVDIDAAAEHMILVEEYKGCSIINLYKKKKKSVPEIFHDPQCKEAVISGDGSTCAFYKRNGTIHVGKIKSLPNIKTLSHPWHMIAFSLSYCGRYLLTISKDKCVRLYDLSLNIQPVVMTLDDLPLCCAFAEEASVVLIGSERCHLYCLKIENAVFHRPPVTVDSVDLTKKSERIKNIFLKIFNKKSK